MSSWLAVGGTIAAVLAVAGFVWLALRNERRRGEAIERGRQAGSVIEAQDAIARVQASPQGPEETERRLRDGTF